MPTGLRCLPGWGPQYEWDNTCVREVLLSRLSMGIAVSTLGWSRGTLKAHQPLHPFALALEAPSLFMLGPEL